MATSPDDEKTKPTASDTANPKLGVTVPTQSDDAREESDDSKTPDETKLTNVTPASTQLRTRPAPIPTPSPSKTNDQSMEGGSQKPLPQYKGLMIFQVVFTGDAFKDFLAGLFGLLDNLGLHVARNILGKAIKTGAAIFALPFVPFSSKAANFVKNNGLLLSPIAAPLGLLAKGLAKMTGSEKLNNFADGCGQLTKNVVKDVLNVVNPLKLLSPDPYVEVPGKREKIAEDELPPLSKPFSEESGSAKPLADNLERVDTASEALRRTPEGASMPEKGHHDLGFSEDTKVDGSTLTHEGGAPARPASVPGTPPPSYSPAPPVEEKDDHRGLHR